MTTSIGASFLQRYRPLILEDMRAAFDAATAHDPALPLYDVLRYHLGWIDEHGIAAEATGKLLRPSLVLLCAEALGGSAVTVLPAASAVEFIHNFSLIHDDIEDRSESRHGRPTVWKRWGVPLAVNAGDGLWALARLAAHRLSERGAPAERALEVGRRLDEACLRLCEGQDRDIRFEGDTGISVDDYLRMVCGKTGELMAAATSLGAIVLGRPPETVAALHEYGMRLGIAFQMRDDVLGIWGDSARTGKAEADDLYARKISYPVVQALGRAKGRDRAVLVERYGRDMDGDGIDAVLAILERTGAREAAERLAVDASMEAERVLDDIDIPAAARDELRALARFAAERTQ